MVCKRPGSLKPGLLFLPERCLPDQCYIASVTVFGIVGAFAVHSEIISAHVHLFAVKGTIPFIVDGVACE